MQDDVPAAAASFGLGAGACTGPDHQSANAPGASACRETAGMGDRGLSGAHSAEPAAPARPTLVNSAIALALDSRRMQIECAFMRGFAGVQLIGNTTEVCRDGKERARAALERLGLHIPPRRLVVNLTPADVKKDGNHLDLPIAMSLALLLAPWPLRRSAEGPIAPARWLFAAELGLAGELRPVKGVASFAVAAMAAQLDGLVVAHANAKEVSLLANLARPGGQGLQTLGFETLADVLRWMFDLEAAGGVAWASPPAERHVDLLPALPTPRVRIEDSGPADPPNFDDMILNPVLARAAAVVAAGMHSILLRGSPGTGKSMFAARLPSLLPLLKGDDHIDVLRIYSAHREQLPRSLLEGHPPYRAPHHSASAAAVLGNEESPGELSLAHGGVLFLDELTEFRRDLLESLREPLETGEVRVSRSRRKLAWMARIILVAACNNCPCGWAHSSRRECQCSPGRLAAYRQRLSGPILDRIDIHLNIPEPRQASADLFLRLAQDAKQSQTAQLRDQVVAARSMAQQRNRAFGVVFNRDLAAQHVLPMSGLSEDAFEALVNRLLPAVASNRAILRTLRVARTLADLDGSPHLRARDLEQAWAWQSEQASRERGEHAYNRA